jgi:hypothetical protein
MLHGHSSEHGKIGAETCTTVRFMMRQWEFSISIFVVARRAETRSYCPKLVGQKIVFKEGSSRPCLGSFFSKRKECCVW